MNLALTELRVLLKQHSNKVEKFDLCGRLTYVKCNKFHMYMCMSRKNVNFTNVLSPDGNIGITSCNFVSGSSRNV